MMTPQQRREVGARRSLMKLLRTEKEVHALNPGAYIAMLALAIEMLQRGQTVKAKIVKAYSH